MHILFRLTHGFVKEENKYAYKDVIYVVNGVNSK